MTARTTVKRVLAAVALGLLTAAIWTGDWRFALTAAVALVADLFVFVAEEIDRERFRTGRTQP